LSRIIDDEIKKPLSRMILFGDLQEGGRVEVTVKDDKLNIEYKKSQVLDQFKPRVTDEKTSQ
jgi:ATP-dependent Clp protease ATP-binding subunit ClpA